jgi:hypothetical protein
MLFCTTRTFRISSSSSPSFLPCYPYSRKIYDEALEAACHVPEYEPYAAAQTSVPVSVEVLPHRHFSTDPFPEVEVLQQASLKMVYSAIPVTDGKVSQFVEEEVVVEV